LNKVKRLHDHLKGFASRANGIVRQCGSPRCGSCPKKKCWRLNPDPSLLPRVSIDAKPANLVKRMGDENSGDQAKRKVTRRTGFQPLRSCDVLHDPPVLTSIRREARALHENSGCLRINRSWGSAIARSRPGLADAVRKIGEAACCVNRKPVHTANPSEVASNR